MARFVGLSLLTSLTSIQFMEKGINNMATIREWLSESNFDWKDGTIIYQETGDNYPGWGRVTSASIIENDHPILDENFDDGFGGPDCPRFVAKDKNHTYFPGQYDGSTFIVVVSANMDDYLNGLETPYPGG